MNETKCADCKSPIPDAHEARDDDRSPCPHCGCLNRIFEVTLEERVTAYDSLAFKARHGPTGRPFAEGKSGYEFNYDRQKMVLRGLHVDREANLYRESVIDPDTGEVIHQVEEPLSAHQGHGAARRRPKDV
jgi:hypothetical protein